jgi:hypothetical protein
VVLLIIIVLIAAAISGSLGAVLEVAVGVALGLVLFVVGIGVAAWWFLRRRIRAAGRELDRYRGQGSTRRDYPGDRRA